jgi:superfamily II DNA helicase RecQ
MERTQARGLLKQMLGPEAEFREGQWEAIDSRQTARQRLKNLWSDQNAMVQQNARTVLR